MATRTLEEMTQFLVSYGWRIGQRDPRLNTNYPGQYMVVEAYEESDLPTEDGRDGPWCIVGDDLAMLVETGYDALNSMVSDYSYD